MTGRTDLPEWERDDSRERAILVGVDLNRPGWPLEEDLAELARLADTAGADVVATITQRLDRPHPKTFVGSGKIEEIESLADATQATMIVFDDDLSPSQQTNVQEMLPNIRVLDRTKLILDIFALHAVSREGKLQVELAQLEYLLPRLRGMWGHLEAERLGGGRGTRFGAGESQLETDRRLARRRIADLRKELRHVASARETQRKSRKEHGIFRIALVGYTNAGKSTLLNALTGAGVLVEDMLFATLDSTTRKLDLPDGRLVTVTDTVGFINKLPHGLVEAFKSTLDEVREADLLLHVVDGSHTQAEPHAAAVDVVLHELGAHGKPRVFVVNKIDAMSQEQMTALRRRHPDAVFVSGSTRRGLDDLLKRIQSEAARGSLTFTVLLPYTRGDLVQLAHERAHIVSERHTENGTALVVQVPPDIAASFEQFRVDAKDAPQPIDAV
ncbi:MAG: GTPase HflX [Actinobacteria bacterium HGW-Actinobacteria-9]|jgi:GTP-binding protein HflX|nr:MAG: GTPase HflX [Actinobacteria bacterium HGW-Actinobacteria-9]